jgi:hypothetical protein
MLEIQSEDDWVRVRYSVGHILEVWASQDSIKFNRDDYCEE